jgi:hypothetical protein
VRHYYTGGRFAQKDDDYGICYGATDGRGEYYCTQEQACQKETRKKRALMIKEAKAANSKPESNPNPSPNPELPALPQSGAGCFSTPEPNPNPNPNPTPASPNGTIKGSTVTDAEVDEDDGARCVTKQRVRPRPRW